MPDTHVILKGTKRTQRAGAKVLGRTDAHEWCEITLKLRRKKPLPEPSLKGKAVLTQADFANGYGAAAEDISTVEKVLAKYGITVESANAATRSVKAGGPAAAMEKAFNVHLFHSRQDGRDFRSRVGELSVPTELDGIVQGLFGLDTRRMARHRATAKKRQQTIPAPANRPWFLPQELAALYGFPPGDGTGQTIGVIELGGMYSESDLAEFVQLSGLTSTATVEVVAVEKIASADANNADESTEVMLDIEVVAGVCPKATIAAYFSNFTEQGWVDVLDAAVHDTERKPSVLTISWGLAEGEDIWTAQAMTAINDSMQEAATLGLPVCVSAGDDGSDDQVGDGLAHVDFPGSSPYVLCVGGTTLVKQSNGGTTETVWKEGDGLRADNGGSTGGGVSTVFPRPSWQNVKITSVNPNAIDGRVVPDVAADAAGGTGYFVVAGGKPGVVGGTSAATPLWASLIARLNAARGAGKDVGYLTPVLYQTTPQTGGKPLGAVACNDITSGNNNTAADGGYSAGPGYDATTGWGSPNGPKLLQLIP